MPFSGYRRTRFRLHNEYRDNFAYLINGMDTDTGLLSNVCTRFDL